MRFINFSILLLWLFSLYSCSSNKGTPVNLKVRIAGLGTLPNGIGDGGAMLYGRSSDGKLFSKKIQLSDEVLDIPNGQWTFYALFWDTTNTYLNGEVYCAKSTASLSGADVSVALNASNANCADVEFSNGQHYVNGSSKVQFPDIFVEDCDELPASGYTCGLLNQGNALSYRFVLSEFKKDPSIPFLFAPVNKQFSACQPVSETPTHGSVKSRLPINFPLGNGIAPFVAQVQLFFGSSTCDETDPKGNQVVNLSGAQSLGVRKVISNQVCDSGIGTYYDTLDPVLNEKRCRDDLGTWTGSVSLGSCNLSSFPASTKRFIPPTQCTTMSTVTYANKFLLSVPKNTVCDRYIGSSAIIGTHPFSAGDGSSYRPYKICTEWQLNQIGEVNAPASFVNASYKLLNDLDMNKIERNEYSKPTCLNVAGSFLKGHSTFNPLDKIHYGDCSTVKTSENFGFNGTFNGNNKTIRSVRVHSLSVSKIGFTRELGIGGRIINLILKKPEYDGLEYVGGVAGFVSGYDTHINNIVIKDFYADGMQDYVGGVAGKIIYDSNINTVKNVSLEGGDINGNNYVGGLVGYLGGEVSKSSFRGLIESHNSAASTYLGGIAGKNISNSTISASFSEGIIKSNNHYVGGISGYNAGNLTDVYSTMAITAGHGSAGFVGGLSGYNDAAGAINRSFYSGSLRYTGSAPSSFYGSSSATGSYSFTYSNTSTNSIDTALTYTQMRLGNIDLDSSPLWVQSAGSIPRLVFENRECLNSINLATVTVQAAAGRGSLLNPILICRASQLKDMEGRSSSEYYRIIDDIDLSNWSSLADTIVNFNGTLLGDDRYLYGLSLSLSSGTSNEDIGIFQLNNGDIKNLNLANIVIQNLDISDMSAGLLVGRNALNGKLNKIIIENGSIQSTNVVGSVVGRNEGEINKVSVYDVTIQGDQMIGGIAGVNSTGSITKTTNNATITNITSSFGIYGGVVGQNWGMISENQFKGNIYSSTQTVIPEVEVGGIAGYNNGMIINTLVHPQAEIKLQDYENVGGLVGRQDSSGVLSKSVYLGKIIYQYPGPTVVPAAQYFHPLIGNKIGGTHSDLFHYRNIGSHVGTYTVSSATPNGLEYDHNLSSGDSFTQSASSDKVGFIFNSSYSGNSFTPVTISTDDILTAPIQVASGGSVEGILPYAYDTSWGASFAYTFSDMESFSTFCPSTTGSAGYETCTAGLDIGLLEDDVASSKGYYRIMNYFMAELYDGPLPGNAPIWIFESSAGDGLDFGPRLINLDD